MDEKLLDEFKEFLYDNEKSEATVSKYLHDITVFLQFIQGREIDKTLVLNYKKSLLDKYATASANSMIAALNCFLKFIKKQDCVIKQFKIQRKAFCEEEKELTKEEYIRLINTANNTGNERLSLVIQTICSTGIRVSELPFITVEAAKCGEAIVRCKGKTRTVFLVKQLCKRLLQYSKKNKIATGAIFVTKTGKLLSRSNIWREMKALCEKARVSANKVFPHNLRHLFARLFYRIEKDIAKLADILGHSNINTTRIYIISSGVEHRRKMESMRLII